MKEIRNWHDLNAVRGGPNDSYVLLNDLCSKTEGYEECAGRAADEGKRWKPIGNDDEPFTGSFDGRDHRICDLFISRLDGDCIGLFDVVRKDVEAREKGKRGRGKIKNVGVVRANISGNTCVGALAGVYEQNVTIRNCYSTGRVRDNNIVGGHCRK